MLKFIEESDFLKVDTFKENEDGSVSWVWDEGEGLPTHSGTIYEGFKRFTQDSEDNKVEIDVWEKLQELEAAGEIAIEYPTQEELTAREYEKQVQAFKSERQRLLDTAIVTTSNSLQFDADEQSITRMANAILAAQDEGTVNLSWSLADTPTGVMTEITLADLREAHKLAVKNMETIWGIS